MVISKTIKEYLKFGMETSFVNALTSLQLQEKVYMDMLLEKLKNVKHVFLVDGYVSVECPESVYVICFHPYEKDSISFLPDTVNHALIMELMNFHHNLPLHVKFYIISPNKSDEVIRRLAMKKKQ